MNVESAFRHLEGTLAETSSRQSCTVEQLLLWATHLLFHEHSRLKPESQIFFVDLQGFRQTAKEAFEHLTTHWREAPIELRDAHSRLQHAIDALAKDVEFKSVP